MKNQLIVALSVLTIVGCANTGTLSGQSDEKTIRDIEAARINALLGNDAAALEAIYADDLVHTSQDGRTSTKAQRVAAAKAGRFHFTKLITDDVTARVYGGDAAVVTGRFEGAGDVGGNPVKGPFLRYTCVYIKRDGRWQLVAQQITPITDAK